jgi:hypothetical protein
MSGWSHWYLDGQEVLESAALAAGDTRSVRVLQGALGTELRWHVHEPNFAALLMAQLTLSECPPPYILRFNLAGWFEESYETVPEAQLRVGDLIARADRFRPNRIYVEEVEPDPSRMPPVLKDVWQLEKAADDVAIKCHFDAQSETYVVNHVGPKSLIGRVWGTNPTTSPCLSSGPFASSANHSYRRATLEGRPLYEHVLAPFNFPDTEVRWIRYHRLIIPESCGDTRGNVSIISECADVAFRI